MFITLVIMMVFSMSDLSNQKISYTQPTFSIIPQQAVKSVCLSVHKKKKNKTNGNFMSESIFLCSSP